MVVVSFVENAVRVGWGSTQGTGSEKACRAVIREIELRG